MKKCLASLLCYTLDLLSILIGIASFFVTGMDYNMSCITTVFKTPPLLGFILEMLLYSSSTTSKQ